MIASYHLGLPLWGLSAWVGNLYRSGTRQSEYLSEYAKVFNSVEGNTTFYQVPSADSVERWREATPAGFEFCLKLPSVITHAHRLHSVGALLTEFFARVEPLGDRLGPFMVQLPAGFTPAELDLLLGFLRSLPSAFRYAVEVRHVSFFDNGSIRRRLDEGLHEAGVERVIMDTRALRSGDPNHPDVRNALHDKPDVPVREVALTHFPVVRFIGHPDSDVNSPWLDRWAERVSSWLSEGKHPYFFIHCANNLYAPRFAKAFHERLFRAVGERVGTLAPIAAVQDQRQLGLFS